MPICYVNSSLFIPPMTITEEVYIFNFINIIWDPFCHVKQYNNQSNLHFKIFPLPICTWSSNSWLKAQYEMPQALVINVLLHSRKWITFRDLMVHSPVGYGQHSGSTWEIVPVGHGPRPRRT